MTGKRFQARRVYHLGFGFGEHVCLGRNLATLELNMLLSELLDQVEHISILEAVRGSNNGLRGFSRLQVAFR